MDQEVYHTPVLLQASVDALDMKPGGTYVDATYGGGGHSREILSRLGTDGHLYSFDQDRDAVERAISGDERFTMVYGNFRYLANFLRYYDALPVDGILADLGVSSHHFDDASRGFSFRADAPLDMRMNQRGRLTAADVVADYSEERLADIFYLYGELKQSRRLAAAIVKARKQQPIVTTGDLIAATAQLISQAKQKKELAQLFQALRIEVNGEMEALQRFLEATPKVLRKGGRLAVITYHSLEDRMVKNFMRSGNVAGRVETDFYGRTSSPWRVLGSKPVVPDEAETEANPRARSAKLRVAELI